MNIHFNSCSHFALSLFKERILSSLTVQQKTILTIAAAAFAFLGACLVVRRFCFKAVHENDAQEDIWNLGKRVYPNGTKDEDHFKNSQLHRQVKRIPGKLDPSDILVKEDGTVEEGEFKEGKLHGRGKRTVGKRSSLTKDNILIDEEGTIEEGLFKDGLLNDPSGKITRKNGSIETGVFKNGKLNGLGQIKQVDGTISKGTFEEGVLNGPGEVTTFNGVIMKGVFKNNSLNGAGMIVFPQGIIQKGQFLNGKLNGRGRILFQNVQKIVGEPKGKLPEKGQFKIPDKYIMEADFRNGEPHGHYKMITLDGKIIEEGECADGNFIEPKK